MKKKIRKRLSSGNGRSPCVKDESRGFLLAQVSFSTPRLMLFRQHLIHFQAKELHVLEDNIIWETWYTGQHGNEALLSLRAQDSSSFVADAKVTSLFLMHTR